MNDDHTEADDCLICRQVAALERIADTLDDYMAMSIASLAAMTAIQARDPALAEIVKPMADGLRQIVDRRAARRKDTQ